MTNSPAPTTKLRSGKVIPSPPEQAATPKATERDTAGAQTPAQADTAGPQSLRPQAKGVLHPQPKKVSAAIADAFGKPKQIVADKDPTHSPDSSSSVVEAVASPERDETPDRDMAPYPNHGDDPDQLPKNSPKKVYDEYVAKLAAYTSDIYEAYSRCTRMSGELLWQDFLTAFRPHTIRSWSRGTLAEWRELLVHRGVHVDTDRSRPLSERIIDILYRPEHISVKEAMSEPGQKTSDAATGTQDTARNIHGEGTVKTTENDDAQTEKGQREDDEATNEKKEDERDGNPKKTTSHTKEKTSPSFPDMDPDSSDSSDSDNPDHNADDHSRDKKGGRQGSSTNTKWESRPTRKRQDTSQDDEDTSDARPLGISGMQKGFVNLPTFSGLFKDDLDGVIESFETLAEMCDLTKDQKRKSIPVMLSGNAFRLYSKNKQLATTYEKGIDLLRGWYTSEAKQNRLLSQWNTMRLSEALSKKPEGTEVDVFKDFIDSLMSIQQQLHSTYQTDRQLRDRLLTAVDLPSIRESLNDRQPRTAHQLIERVANKLSGKDGSAGTTIACMASRGTMDIATRTPETYYTLGQRFGGDAKRTIRRYSNRGGRSRGPQRSNKYERQRPKWMQGIKGCFKCGKDHRANDFHTREEVTEAIRKLKARHPTASLSRAEKAFIADLYSDSDNSDQDEGCYEAVIDGDPEDDDDEDDQAGDTITAYMAKTDMQSIESELATSSFAHSLVIDARDTDAGFDDNLGTYAADSTARFAGIRIDTCANRRSIMCVSQYRQYCVMMGLKETINTDTRVIHGVGGDQTSIGSSIVQIPFPTPGFIIDVDFLLFAEESTPSLLGLKDMLENGLEISIQNKTIQCVWLPADRPPQDLKLINFFLVHNWTRQDMPYIFYTESDLRTIHKAFGHPSVQSTKDLIRRAGDGHIDKLSAQRIERIAQDCRTCKLYATAPRRFKLTIGCNDLRFNHVVQVDTMYLDGAPVLHMVDIATHFCAAGFLRTQTSAEVWNMIQTLWSWVYLGPPDTLEVDQGSNFVSRETKENAEAEGVTLREAPIETPGAIGTVERYHAPLRRAYRTIRKDLGRDTSDAQCLRMAVFAVNSTIGPEGLCPMLLVFGAIPRPARSISSPTQVQRAVAIEQASRKVSQEQAKRRLAFGLRHNKSPARNNENTRRLAELPAGAPVLVWRTKSASWEGPVPFISIDGETVVLQMSTGRKIFRSTCVRPMNGTDWDQAQMRNQCGSAAGKDGNHNQCQVYEVEEVTGKTLEDAIQPGERVGKAKRSKKTPPAYRSSREKELRGLMEMGTFRPVSRDDVPPGTRIFNSCFVDELKRAGGGLKRKSRLVAQNYEDEDSAYIATKAPTVQRFTQRVILSLAASIPTMKCFTRDVTQAYVQSDKKLEREVFIDAPRELQLPENTVLKVIRPLYGIPESGLHWYITYLEYHQTVLNMKRTRVDPCLLIRRDDDGNLNGMTILQVDDSLTVGTDDFLNEEERGSKNFLSKPRQFLTTQPQTFNGTQLRKDDDGSIRTDQADKIAKLTAPQTQKGFSSMRALAQYIGVCCRPDICAYTQLIAPGAEPTTIEEMNSLQKIVTHLTQTKETSLNFVQLNLSTVRLVMVSDSSFANARDMKSQLGFIILMADETGRCNLVHFGSARCRRVARSVMAAELHALTLGFDFAYVVRDMIQEILGRPIDLEAYTDNKSVFDMVAKDGKSAERRLQIDICAVRESYAKGELTKIGWIPGTRNPADALTRETVSTTSELWKLIESNHISLQPEGWATVTARERTPKPANVD